MEKRKIKVLAVGLLVATGISLAVFCASLKEKAPDRDRGVRNDPSVYDSGPAAEGEKGLHDPFQDVLEDIDRIDEYYQAGEYRKARTLLDEVKRVVFEESPDRGAEYPTSVTLNLRILDKLLMDREGAFEDFPAFTGTAREVMGGTTGCFTVVGKEESMNFIYERDLLIKGDLEFSGKKVTVYYTGPDAWGTHTALKIAVDP